MFPDCFRENSAYTTAGAKSGVLSLLPTLSWACLFLLVMLSKGETSADEKEYQILEGMRPTDQQSRVAFKATEKGLVTMTAKAHLPGGKRKKNREREPASQPLSAVAKGPPGALYSLHPQEEADKSSPIIPVLHRCQLLTPSRGNKQKLTSVFPVLHRCQLLIPSGGSEQRLTRPLALLCRCQFFIPSGGRQRLTRPCLFYTDINS